MSDTNSYQSPDILEEQVILRNPMENVAIGQKFIVYAMLISFAGLISLMVIGGVIAITVNSISSILGLLGLFKLSKGMGYSLLHKLIISLLILSPIISVVTILFLNARATEKLKYNGYTVGFLGAHK